MVRIPPLLLGLAVFACSDAGPGPSPSRGWQPSDPDLRVVNATGEPFAFFAIAADLAPLLDPVPEVELGDSSIQLVPAGAERTLVEISGRGEAPGGGVAIFLYALTDDPTRARFVRVQLVSGEETRQAGGRIVIRQLGP